MIPNQIESNEGLPLSQRREDAFLLFLAASVVFGLVTTVVLLCAGY